MTDAQLITDGACKGNPGPGGWAALIKQKTEEKLITGGERETTNNRMEMTAVIEGMRFLGKEPKEILIISDSKYVIDAFEKNWIGSWLRNNWRTAAKKPVKNQDLWQTLIALLEPHKITWEWVKGHAGHPENEIVDQAAQKAADEIFY